MEEFPLQSSQPFEIHELFGYVSLTLIQKMIYHKDHTNNLCDPQERYECHECASSNQQA